MTTTKRLRTYGNAFGNLSTRKKKAPTLLYKPKGAKLRNLLFKPKPIKRKKILPI